MDERVQAVPDLTRDDEVAAQVATGPLKQPAVTVPAGCARTARTPPAGRSAPGSWPYDPPPSRAPASSPPPANP
ncbi:DUF6192 family protein [Streptomyces sp. SAI-149]|uniref:DUF6192 family protein n=1 Tax=unclassified Streptomyces TaxID=2593676 RepID=UPI002474930E|nr:DUF6192 family protein [Streptomyces sp. SAI-149]